MLGFLALVFSRTPHGVRELKHSCTISYATKISRTPHGVRELKLLQLILRDKRDAVAPRTGCVN